MVTRTADLIILNDISQVIYLQNMKVGDGKIERPGGDKIRIGATIDNNCSVGPHKRNPTHYDWPDDALTFKLALYV